MRAKRRLVIGVSIAALTLGLVQATQPEPEVEWWCYRAGLPGPHRDQGGDEDRPCTQDEIDNIPTTRSGPDRGPNTN